MEAGAALARAVFEALAAFRLPSSLATAFAFVCDTVERAGPTSGL